MKIVAMLVDTGSLNAFHIRICTAHRVSRKTEYNLKIVKYWLIFFAEYKSQIKIIMRFFYSTNNFRHNFS